MTVIEVPLSPPRRSGVLATRNAVYQLKVDESIGEGWITRSDLAWLTLVDGRVTIGQTPLYAPQFGDDSLTWLQQVPGRFSAGRLMFAEDGVSLYGAITVGTTVDDAVTVEVAGHVGRSVTYDTKVTKTPYRKDTDPMTVPADHWTAGRELEIGYELDPSSLNSDPRPKIRLKKADGQYTDVEGRYIVEHDAAVLLIDTPDIVCDSMKDDEHDPGFYRAGRLAFSIKELSPTGRGWLSATCAGAVNKNDPEQVLLWQAVPREPKGAAELPLLLSAAEHEAYFDGVEVLLETEDLTLSDLYNQLPDDFLVDGKGGVEKVMDSPLSRNMKWAMSKQKPEADWLRDFMQASEPAMDDEQVALASSGQEWYRKWGRAYLTKSFDEYRGQGQSTVFLDQGEKAKLDCYFKSGLYKDAQFNVQYQGLYVETYIAHKRRIKLYIADKNGDWARKLFDEAMKPANFVNVANAYTNLDSRDSAMKLIKKTGTLLLALDRSGNYAHQYYEAITTGVVGKMCHNVKHQDPKFSLTWLPDVISGLIKQIADGKDPGTSGISKTEAAEMYAYISDHLTAFSADVATFLANLKGTGIYKLSQEAQDGYDEAIASKHPKMKKFGRLMFLAAWAGNVYAVMTALLREDWQQMTEKERAEAVTESLGTTLEAAKAMKTIWAGAKKLGAVVWGQISRWYSFDGVRAGFAKIANKLTGLTRWLPRAGQVFKKLLAVGIDKMGLGTLFAKIFSGTVLKLALKTLSVAISVALTVLALVDLIECLAKGSTITETVLSAISLAAALVGTVCLVLGFVFVGVAAIPIIGFIAALVGIIASVIRWFTSTPPNPLTDFMNNYGKPFVQGLAEVSDECKKVPKAHQNGQGLVLLVTV
ncbi:hypothetical protein ACIQWA_03945 [Kitasatospora sp. NPDC098652]|uniref:hypothetical protein n=1 Tax=Kitasatospora sp. NPDC098652 TaxID=3364095 RepID=UPI00381EB2C1